MTTIESSFKLAPFSSNGGKRADELAEEIMGEAGAFDQVEFTPTEDGQRLQPADLSDNDFDGVLFKEGICNLINRLIELIRSRVDSFFPGKRPTSIDFGSIYYNELGFEDEGASITSWHIDHKDFVFIAFGERASIEIILGRVKIDVDKDDLTFEDGIQDCTTDALQQALVKKEVVPNGVPVILNEDTIHRRGPIKEEGLRFSMSLSYD